MYSDYKLIFTVFYPFHNKDDIEFVTEFPCFLGHSPVYEYIAKVYYNVILHI